MSAIFVCLAAILGTLTMAQAMTDLEVGEHGFARFEIGLGLVLWLFVIIRAFQEVTP